MVVAVIIRGPELGQVVILATHPRLLRRHLDALDPDFPGLFSDAERRAGRGITLFLQGAVGNVSAADAFHREEAFANEHSKANSQATLAPLGPTSPDLRRLTTACPPSHASRRVPRGLAGDRRNLLGRSSH